MGVSPGERQDAQYVSVSPGERLNCMESGCFSRRDDCCAEDGYSPDEMNYCKCIIG